jgi:hypothetical protein
MTGRIDSQRVAGARARKSERRRCAAHSSRTGLPCRLPPILGGTVCIVHGGRAPQVKRKALERMRELVNPTRLLEELACLAYFDVRDLFRPDGSLKPINEMPEDARRAIMGFEVTKRNLTAGDGEQEDVVKVKLADKNKSVETLARVLGMLVDRFALVDNEAKLQLLDQGRERNRQAALEEQRARDAKPVGAGSTPRQLPPATE